MARITWQEPFEMNTSTAIAWRGGPAPKRWRITRLWAATWIRERFSTFPAPRSQVRRRPPMSRMRAKLRSTFSAQLEGLAGDRALEPRPVVVPPGRGVTVPAGESLLLLLGDAALPGAVLQCLQALTRMIARVGDHLGRSLRGRRAADQIEHGFGLFQRASQRLGVPLVGRMDPGRHDHAGVEIDGVLGLSSEVRGAVL